MLLAFFSILRQILSITSTAAIGYFPAAVSPDSITASVPSSTALATSELSARVGRGLTIIESSICVAVITGLPAIRDFLIIRFWTIGTSSEAISIPRRSEEHTSELQSRGHLVCRLLLYKTK